MSIPANYVAHLTLIKKPVKSNPTKIQVTGFHWKVLTEQNTLVGEGTYEVTGANGFQNADGLCAWYKNRMLKQHPEILETILTNTIHGTYIAWATVTQKYENLVDNENLVLTTYYSHKSGQKVENIITLAEHSPHIAAEANGWNPNLYPYASHLTMPWKCAKETCEYVWKAEIALRTSSVPDCPKCKGRVLIKGHNDLLTTHPEIAATAYGWNPSEYRAGSEQKMKWKCNAKGCEEIWTQMIKSRIHNNGCQRCSQSWNYIEVGYNDLATTHPNLVKELVNVDPTTIKEGSNLKVEWKCSKEDCGHVWKTVVANRAQKKSGCPACQGRVAEYGVNDIYTNYPTLAQEAYGWDPKTIPVGSKKKLAWKCKVKECSWIWKTTPYNRINKKTGCPSCTNRVLNKGYNDLATRRPDLISQAQFDPYNTIYVSQNVVRWKCDKKECSYEWNLRLFNRSKNKNISCPSCSNRVLNKGYNDLATKRPDLAAEALFNPTEYTTVVRIKKRWKCSQKNCGHVWSATIKSRTKVGTGCPKCAHGGGYNKELPGYLYLIERTYYGKLQTQIGISNYPKQRLATHKRNRWQPIEILGACEGKQISEIEQMFLKKIKKQYNIRTGKKAFSKKFDGYTEAWWSNDYPVTSIADILKTCEITFDELQHAKEGKTTK